MKTTTLLFTAALMLGMTTASAQGSAPRIALDTSHGRIVIELAPKEAPKMVDNFLTYVKAGHYDGTVFHRVIPTFMIQGGGFSDDMAERPTRAPIPLESRNGLKNDRGAVRRSKWCSPMRLHRSAPRTVSASSTASTAATRRATARSRAAASA